MSPLELFRELWHQRCDVPLIEVVNYPNDTNGFPDEWGAALYQSTTRTDVSLGSHPWVEEQGFILVGLFTRSGRGPDALDDAVDKVRAAFHGAAIDNLLIESVDGPHDVDPEGDGEWWQLAMTANFKVQTRRAPWQP